MALHPQLNELIENFLPFFQDLHRKGMFAPNAASVEADGNLSGHALTTDGRTEISAEQGMELLQGPLLEKAKTGEIVAVGVFYHSAGFDVPSHSLPPATHVDDCRSLVGLLEHVSGDSVHLVIPYTGSPPDIEYSRGKLIEKPRRYFPAVATQDQKASEHEVGEREPIEQAPAQPVLVAKRAWWKFW